RGQCGIEKPEKGLLRVDAISRSVEWWFAYASSGNLEIHLPDSPRPWKVPAWVAPNGGSATSLLQSSTLNLGFRLNHVLEEELDLAEIRAASTGGSDDLRRTLAAQRS